MDIGAVDLQQKHTKAKRDHQLDSTSQGLRRRQSRRTQCCIVLVLKLISPVSFTGSTYVGGIRIIAGDKDKRHNRLEYTNRALYVRVTVP